MAIGLAIGTVVNADTPDLITVEPYQFQVKEIVQVFPMIANGPRDAHGRRRATLFVRPLESVSSYVLQVSCFLCHRWFLHALNFL